MRGTSQLMNLNQSPADSGHFCCARRRRDIQAFSPRTLTRKYFDWHCQKTFTNRVDLWWLAKSVCRALQGTEVLWRALGRLTVKPSSLDGQQALGTAVKGSAA